MRAGVPCGVPSAGIDFGGEAAEGGYPDPYCGRGTHDCDTLISSDDSVSQTPCDAPDVQVEHFHRSRPESRSIQLPSRSFLVGIHNNGG